MINTARNIADAAGVVFLDVDRLWAREYPDTEGRPWGAPEARRLMWDKATREKRPLPELQRVVDLVTHPTHSLPARLGCSVDSDAWTLSYSVSSWNTESREFFAFGAKIKLDIDDIYPSSERYAGSGYIAVSTQAGEPRMYDPSIPHVPAFVAGGALIDEWLAAAWRKCHAARYVTLLNTLPGQLGTGALPHGECALRLRGARDNDSEVDRNHRGFEAWDVERQATLTRFEEYAKPTPARFDR